MAVCPGMTVKTSWRNINLAGACRLVMKKEKITTDLNLILGYR